MFDKKINCRFISKDANFTAAQLLALKLKQDSEWLTDDYLPTYLEPFLNSEEVRLGINDHGMVHAIFENKKTKPVFVDNYSWLGKLNYIDFLLYLCQTFFVFQALLNFFLLYFAY